MTDYTNYQYFGNITFYKNIVDRSNVEFRLYEPYRKSAHLNRTTVSGANGLIKLNIPLAGGREQRKSFYQVRVSFDENWRIGHFRSILSSYRRSPWYEQFHDDLSVFYRQEYTWLWEWNRASFHWVVKVLSLEVDGKERFKPEENPKEDSAKLFKTGSGYITKRENETRNFPCKIAPTDEAQMKPEGNAVNPEPSLSGKGGKLLKETDSIDKEIWRPYPQVFGDRFGFIPNLSILDLLFCLGPRLARNYIMGR